MKYELYLIKNLINNKQYIGQTSEKVGYEKRFRQHVQQSLNPNTLTSDFHLHRAIRKYGKDNFSIKRLLHGIGEEDIDRLEKIWIKKFNTFSQDGCGYNMTKGGQGVHGYVFSEKTRQLLSEKHKSYWQDLKENNPEEYIRLCEIRKHNRAGKKASMETRQRLSEIAKSRVGDLNPFYGKHHTVKTKSLIAQANSKKIRMLSKEGELIMEFPSISEAVRFLISKNITTNKSAGSRIQTVANHISGQGTIAYGYKWEFLD